LGVRGPIRVSLFNQEIHQSGTTPNLNQFDHLAIELKWLFKPEQAAKSTLSSQ
jgi:hypothetical protein